MNNKVVCDKCNKKFELKLKTRKLPLGIEENYFICLHCNTKYVSFYTDESIREKQKKINKMWKDYRQLRDPAAIADMAINITELKAEIKADMEELKKKMEK
jgi:hypothetical protein